MYTSPTQPAVLYHGTSSVNLPGIMRGELNPLGTYSGQIALTADLSEAVRMAMIQTYWDAQALGCDRMAVTVKPIVCQVDPRGLNPQYLTTSTTPGKYGYTQPIRLGRGAIVPVSLGV